MKANHSSRFDRLRKQAVAALAAGHGDGPSGVRLLHEMEVLQVELELQQDELVASQQRSVQLAAHYHQLFFESPLAMVLLDEAQHLRDMNQQAMSLLGIMSERGAQTGFEQFVASEDQAAWVQLWGKGQLRPVKAQLQLRRLGGEKRRCEVSLTRQGQGLLVSLEDLTSLRAAEERESLADERLAHLLRESRDGVLFYDAATSLVTQLNASLGASLGASEGQLLGRPLDSLFPEGDVALQEFALKHATLVPRAEGVVPLNFRARDGAVLQTEATVGKFSEGGRTFVTLLLRDVSDRRRLEAERDALTVARAQGQKLQALGQLAAGIAHDINNVLATVLACASVDAQGSKERLVDAMEDIRAAALRGRDVTGRLGVFARNEPLRRNRFELLSMLRELVGLLQRTLPRRVQVSLEAPAGACFLVGDAGEWHQALLNLAVNARDAMPDGGSLRFSVQAAPDGVVLAVADGGVGMPPEVLQRAFEPFFTTKASGLGTGLGLSQVQAVARTHGVGLELASQLGHGTTFTFHFPGAVVEPVGPAQASEARPALLRGRVLLVDDDALARRAILRLVKQLGFEVTDVDGGAAAVRALEAGGVDLVLSDLSMPQMDGAQLAALVRARWPQVPVLIITGGASEAQQAQLAAAGVVGVLAKPFEAAELRRRLAPLAPQPH